MHGDERRNVVPADWVSAVICRLLETPEAHGGTYHLAPRQHITPREVIEAGYQYFNSYGVEFCGDDGQEVDFLGEMDRDAHENKTIYQAYETTDPTFDTTHLLRFTADLPCPAIDVEMLHRFWRYGEEDRWGKRRSPKLEVPSWVSDLLDSCRSVSLDDRHEPPKHSPAAGRSLIVNLDALGPGGGQWHFPLSGGRIGPPALGLSDGANATLSIGIYDWQRIQYEVPELAVRRLAAALQTRFTDPPPLTLARMLYDGLFPSVRQPALRSG
jgi:hypothetical protein